MRLILSHPDCYRRLRRLTGSADPVMLMTGARGLSSLLKNTAGQEFHPALRTSAF